MPFSVARFSKRRRGRVGSVVVVTDTFTRADSAVSLGTSDSGHAWTAHASTWGIVSNTAYNPGAAGSLYHAASVDAGIADGVIQVTFSTTAVGMGICARVTDDNNFLHLEFGGASDLTLYKRVAGAFTSLGTFGVTGANGDVLKLECRGSTLNAYLNGVLRITASDAFNSSATRWGLSGNTLTPRWDNLTVST